MEEKPTIEQKKGKRPLILTLPARILIVTVSCTIATIMYSMLSKDPFTAILDSISCATLGAVISLLCVRRLTALKKARKNNPSKD